MFYWLCKHILIGPWLRLLFRPSVEGLEHIPDQGGILLIANHVAYVDVLVVGALSRRPVRFLRRAAPDRAWAYRHFNHGQLVQNHFVLPLEQGDRIDRETRSPACLRHHHSRIPCTETRTSKHCTRLMRAHCIR